MALLNAPLKIYQLLLHIEEATLSFIPLKGRLLLQFSVPVLVLLDLLFLRLDTDFVQLLLLVDLLFLMKELLL